MVNNDELVANCVRCLAVDAIKKANSGHPGAPMGLAPAAHVLWSEVMKYDGKDPYWMDRDRFVLSNGHGSALQYCMLHLSGYNVTMDDLKNFRQLGSNTPGHPERNVPPGVEVTTGPLGQGLGAALGLAIAEAHLAATYNRPGFNIFDHWTYVFCGDGCLMEGVGQEALSLAGHLGLEKLVYIYDFNRITIDGGTDIAFTEKPKEKYEALGFHVVEVANGDSDFDAIRKAFEECKTVKGKTKMIILNTTIGYGSLIEGTAAVHGSVLDAGDIKQLKERFGRDPTKSFEVEPAVYDVFKKHTESCQKKHEEWNNMLKKYIETFPAEGKTLQAQIKGELPEGWKSKLPLNDTPLSTRRASEKTLGVLLSNIPGFMGGSADLTPCNFTNPAGAALTDFQRDTPQGAYIRFGVREHGMCAIMNGLDAHGCIIPYGGTFLNFIGYSMGAVRLSALSHHRAIYVATHDSIGVGEDGPTHQPVELVASLRAMPNMLVLRPCDQTETSAAWALAVENKTGPTMLCFSRQCTVPIPTSSMEGVAKGAYHLVTVDKPQLIIAATGSEVGIAVDAAKALSAELRVAVVSMPCHELFDMQPEEYRKQLFPDGVPVLSVEAFSPLGWEKYSHCHIGMTTFGASAPGEILFKHFGITVERTIEMGRKLAEKYKNGDAPIRGMCL